MINVGFKTQLMEYCQVLPKTVFTDTFLSFCVFGCDVGLWNTQRRLGTELVVLAVLDLGVLHR